MCYIISMLKDLLKSPKKLIIAGVIAASLVMGIHKAMECNAPTQSPTNAQILLADAEPKGHKVTNAQILLGLTNVTLSNKEILQRQMNELGISRQKLQKDANKNVQGIQGI